MTINERIRKVRGTVELTQPKFAERIAISLSYLAEIEYGNKPATERIIRLISAEFNVDEQWLRTGVGSMFNEGIDVQISKLISIFKSLNKQFKECAINQMKVLADLQNQDKADK